VFGHVAADQACVWLVGSTTTTLSAFRGAHVGDVGLAASTGGEHRARVANFGGTSWKSWASWHLPEG